MKHLSHHFHDAVVQTDTSGDPIDAKRLRRCDSALQRYNFGRWQGHERVQIVGQQQLHHCDFEVVQQYLREQHD